MWRFHHGGARNLHASNALLYHKWVARHISITLLYKARIIVFSQSQSVGREKTKPVRGSAQIEYMKCAKTVALN